MPNDATDSWTVKRLLTWTTDFLKKKGSESSRLDAEVLLSHVLGWPRVQLYTHFEQDVEEGARSAFRELVNNARATPRTCGDKPFKAAGPLRWNGTLAQAALAHAEDMARYNFFSHDGRDGSRPAQRVARAGYKYRAMGENIAAGQETPNDAVAGWIKSPPHCANLMNPVYTEMGVAFAVSTTSGLGVYWAQEFGTPR